MTKRILWDVDTQVDFVHASGKLPVPDAEAAVPAMERLVRWAAETGVTHLATADDHELTDPEISGDADFETTFPPHCLRGTPGSSKIPETAQRDPLPLSLTPYPPGLVPALVRDRRELLVLKKTYSAFSNPNLDPLLEALDPDEVVVFVEDAAKGLDDARTTACTAAWRDGGVEFKQAAEVVESLG